MRNTFKLFIRIAINSDFQIHLAMVKYFEFGVKSLNVFFCCAVNYSKSDVFLADYYPNAGRRQPVSEVKFELINYQL